jgi:hypothetical protein
MEKMMIDFPTSTICTDDMVMRSVYLQSSDDRKLRQLSHELNVTMSDLIRSAINAKLREWLEPNSDDKTVILKHSAD